MSWFTINHIDTTPVTVELRRIADMFETYLRIAYDYHVTPPKPLAPDVGEPDSVSYASDEELAKQEMLEEVKRFQAVADDIEREGHEGEV